LHGGNRLREIESGGLGPISWTAVPAFSFGELLDGGSGFLANLAERRRQRPRGRWADNYISIEGLVGSNLQRRAADRNGPAARSSQRRQRPPVYGGNGRRMTLHGGPGSTHL
jgi:hypothetical protein